MHPERELIVWENPALAERIRTGITEAQAGQITIESINARIRRAVNARGHFPTEAAALNASTSRS